eukprot:CAMPEP_0197300220 /NCGR_PEP_ID=MMETSP0890-20130614/47898_1 /TAXON_ID=44058 ORGANISM="Aureoumbra lagunensis, Strain CCMP1510" /NCGR_SAMPLE_ID=MMETSP0890 /ASSEMBLY_ACC=CAM_ASM_000533 /LENGTH=122 /DNA_ID=CAMNT_0042778945 /DNA_START=8 /DNA_END=372 /DNA_ORIENTATION=-
MTIAALWSGRGNSPLKRNGHDGMHQPPITASTQKYTTISSMRRREIFVFGHNSDSIGVTMNRIIIANIAATAVAPRIKITLIINFIVDNTANISGDKLEPTDWINVSSIDILLRLLVCRRTR